MKMAIKLFTALFISALLSGCGGGTPPDTPPDTPTIPTTPTTPTTPTEPTTNSKGLLTITNSAYSYYDITKIYVRSSDSTSWNSNYLSYSLPPSYTASITFSTQYCNDYYDVKVVFEDGTDKYKYDNYIKCGYSTDLIAEH